ncbi:MAG: DUF1512 domain-containing protein [Acidilobus sp.]|jgi:hypothetical protein|nr:DUF1512 domain-containing protein [Acidilobus sp.]
MTSGSEISTWATLIVNILWVALLLLWLTGLGNWIQVYWYRADIRSKLTILGGLADEARKETLDYMNRNKAKDASSLLNRLLDFFMIEPVEIEPTDIINRLRHLINIRDVRFKEVFNQVMPDSDEVTRSVASTAAEIASALNFIYKYVRHLLLFAEKTKNWYLILQLEIFMPQIIQIAQMYRKALDDFLYKVPVGDGAGSLVALRLAGFGAKWREVTEDTVVAESEFEGRRLLIIKARGPGSTVGRPGEAAEKAIREAIAQGRRVSLMITVDAALKLEGEETGEVAEGVGAAIGDPGPEKIRFERVATEYNIPLRAVIVKMGMDEAILAMNQHIYKGVENAVERVKQIIRSESREGDTVVVIGVGNTVGVGQ